MKRSLIVVFAAILLSARLVALDESLMPRVAVAPFAATADDPSLRSIGLAITDTIGLTLKLLGTFTVENPAGIEKAGDLASAESVALQNKLDSIVFGSVSRQDDGSFLISLELFSRQKHAIEIERQAKADSVLDVFDAADKLTKEFLEAVSGIHIGFGSIAFENAGEVGDFEVRIDGTSVGRNIGSVQKVLNGRHSITVVQQRLLGELELARVDTMVKEDETVTVKFSVPYMIDGEKKEIEGLFNAARKGIADSDEASADQALAKLDAILAATPWSPRLAELKPTVADLRSLLQATAIRIAVEGRPLEPDASVLAPLSKLIAVVKDPDTKTRLSDMTRETADIEAVLLEYGAAEAASKRDWAGVKTIYDSRDAVLDLADADISAFYRERGARFERAFIAYSSASIPKAKGLAALWDSPKRQFQSYMTRFFAAPIESRKRLAQELAKGVRGGFAIVISPGASPIVETLRLPPFRDGLLVFDDPFANIEVARAQNDGIAEPTWAAKRDLPAAAPTTAAKPNDGRGSPSSPMLYLSAGYFGEVNLISDENFFWGRTYPVGDVEGGPFAGIMVRLLPAWYLGTEVITLSNTTASNTWGLTIDILNAPSDSPWKFKGGFILAPMRGNLLFALKGGIGYGWFQGSIIGLLHSGGGSISIDTLGLLVGLEIPLWDMPYKGTGKAITGLLN